MHECTESLNRYRNTEHVKTLDLTVEYVFQLEAYI